MNEQKYWYAIRATRGRAQSVYDAIRATQLDLEPYLPVKAIVTSNKDNTGHESQTTQLVPLLPSLLFVRCTADTLMELRDKNIPGFTLYYNHTTTDANGRNPLLIIPNHQFVSFRTIVEQAALDIIIDQQTAPTFIQGDIVRVTSGPFQGVIGKVLKFKHQTRVFIEIQGLGTFGTAYVPKCMIEKIEDK